jgi:hypothetical protein
MMSYQDSQRMSKQAAEEAFASTEVKCICEALLSIAFYESDWKWVQRGKRGQLYFPYSNSRSWQRRDLAVM